MAGIMGGHVLPNFQFSIFNFQINSFIWFYSYYLLRVTVQQQAQLTCYWRNSAF